jgi:hypothetical protein
LTKLLQQQHAFLLAFHVLRLVTPVAARASPLSDASSAITTSLMLYNTLSQNTLTKQIEQEAMVPKCAAKPVAERPTACSTAYWYIL